MDLSTFASSLLALWLTIAVLMALAEWRARRQPKTRPNLCSFCGQVSATDVEMRRHVKFECEIHPAYRTHQEVKRVHGEMRRIYQITDPSQADQEPGPKLAQIREIAGSNF